MASTKHDKKRGSSSSGKKKTVAHYQKRNAGRAAVMSGTIKQTSGGLTKDKLVRNKSGRVVSKAKSTLMKKKLNSKEGRAAKEALSKRAEAVKAVAKEFKSSHKRISFKKGSAFHKAVAAKCKHM